MRVLAAVLADAGQISFDVARVRGAVVKRRGEQKDQPVFVPDEMLVDGFHRLARARRVAGAGEHSPSLGDRVDRAGIVLGRAQRRSVVEIGTAIPFSVPGILLDGGAQGIGLLAPVLVRCWSSPATRNDGRELAETGDLEPCQPDTFALALVADPVHAVVPVTVVHQGKAMGTERCAQSRARSAVVVKRARLRPSGRQAVVVILVRPQERPVQVGDRSHQGWLNRRWPPRRQR